MFWLCLLPLVFLWAHSLLTNRYSDDHSKKENFNCNHSVAGFHSPNPCILEQVSKLEKGIKWITVVLPNTSGINNLIVNKFCSKQFHTKELSTWNLYKKKTFWMNLCKVDRSKQMKIIKKSISDRTWGWTREEFIK